VAQNAAQQSGLSPDLLKQMLPMLAMMVGGFMAKQPGQPAAPTSSGGLGDLLGGLLGGGASPAGAGRAPGQAGLAAMLDLNGDGNPLDDVLRLAGKAFK
jgi:hypothetical protein